MHENLAAFGKKEYEHEIAKLNETIRKLEGTGKGGKIKYDTK